jgi:hypothetical protein
MMNWGTAKFLNATWKIIFLRNDRLAYKLLHKEEIILDLFCD